MATQIIYIAGDVHSEWGILNEYINKNIRQSKKFLRLASKHEANLQDIEVIIFQCGDFGIWKQKHIEKLPIHNKVNFLKDGHIKIYFVDGNHENHDLLDKLESDNPHTSFPELAPYIYFCTFGSVLKLIDSTKILFAGGAESADKVWRIEGKEWWQQEGIDKADMAKLPPIDSKIDWVISHAAPLSFDLGVDIQHFRPEKLLEPSRYELDKILKTYQPKKWFFGHYHYSKQGIYLSCEWKCRNYSDATDRNSWLSIETIIQV